MSIIVQERFGFGGFRAFSLISFLISLDQAYRTRRQMARLDDHLLNDIGLQKTGGKSA